MRVPWSSMLCAAILTLVLATLLGAPHSRASEPSAGEAFDLHLAVYQADPYPSAKQCRNCHEGHYREWSVSQHAYAQISPVFNALQGVIIAATNGTFGDFCIRCHTPIGMQLGEPVFASNSDRSAISLEGVTCIVCHRVGRAWGKVSGRRDVVQGDIFQPILGPTGNEENQRVIDERGTYGVVTTSDQPGRRIHSETKKFFQISESGFCATCHDVTFVNGFRLEEAFSEYKHSPAAARGESCQDCHMGIEPGRAEGYREEPVAKMGDAETRVRKRTTHMWVGPDASVVHPGIFPQNPEAAEMATVEEWVLFDHEMGWGTDRFEEAAALDHEFPERWISADDRYDAREIIDQQLALLAEAFERRTRLLRNGYRLGEIVVQRADEKALRFKVKVANGTDGHNVPTGFIGERMVFLQVTVTDAAGRVVFRSGDLDPNGDVRDQHSHYVHNGELPLDRQLFNLQSRFLVRNIRGGEHEQVIAYNYSLDPLPFARPSTRSAVLTGRGRRARTHRMGIEPGGHRWAEYRVKGSELTGMPPYSANVKLMAGALPPNLIGAIHGIGFDYGLSARKIADVLVGEHRVLWERDISLEVKVQ